MFGLRLQHSLSLKTQDPPKRQIVSVLDGASTASDIAVATAEAINLAQETSEPGFILVAAPTQFYADGIVKCITETAKAFVRVEEPDRFGRNGWTERFEVTVEATEASYVDLHIWKVTVNPVIEYPDKK